MDGYAMASVLGVLMEDEQRKKESTPASFARQRQRSHDPWTARRLDIRAAGAAGDRSPAT
ncbi:hypothetical protein [Amycolatopsis sp. NPDC049868]|uniref:hypothetical protein n=1 Tax=Amycolatopsis sp. NPDC049868 TaxID=3363934 RepID=UPI0037B74143